MTFTNVSSTAYRVIAMEGILDWRPWKRLPNCSISAFKGWVITAATSWESCRRRKPRSEKDTIPPIRNHPIFLSVVQKPQDPYGHFQPYEDRCFCHMKTVGLGHCQCLPKPYTLNVNFPNDRRFARFSKFLEAQHHENHTNRRISGMR
jgi:hypothetical protein